jgi:hypothetical protein
MRTLNRPHPHTTTTDRAGRRSVRNDHMPARRPSPQLIADAVIASYIHHISERSRRSVLAPQIHMPRPTHD